MTRVPSSTAEGPLRTFSGSVGPLITDLDGVGAVTATSGPSSGDGSGNGISVVLGIGIAAAVIGAAVIIAGIVYGLRRNALAQKKERDWDELVTLDRGAGGGGANLTGSAAGVGFGLAAGAAAAGSKNREEEISMRKMSQTGNMSTNITIEREMTQRR
ncbi:hypothetical protein BC829DRAFT_407830 [Chytridium lagenaria]|nr:hypothetical protein BC829DRAFT_407830 [Chytridium lagenaria]